MGRLTRWGFGVVAAAALLITGCAGFFPPLTPVTTTPYNPSSPVATTNADFVYVANLANSTIAAFTVTTSATNVGNLAVVPGSPFGLPLMPTAMAITPANSFLFVAGAGGIYAYYIDPSLGSLSMANGGGIDAVTNIATASMAVSPDGQWLFALSDDGQSLYEYGIDALTGVLTLQAASTYLPAGGAIVVPKMIRVSPNGAYVALALGTGGDVIWAFNTYTGQLNPAGYQQIATPGITSSDNALTIDAASTYLYVARSGAGGGVVVYSFLNNGSLAPIAGSPFPTGNGPFDVLLDATGKFLYTANRTDGTISQFTVGTGGVLAAVAGGPALSGSLVGSLARDNSGQYVLAAATGGFPDLTMYGFDATTPGKLDVAVRATTGIDPVAPTLVVASR